MKTTLKKTKWKFPRTDSEFCMYLYREKKLNKNN